MARYTRCAFVNGGGGLFQTLLNKKSPKLDLTITALFPQRTAFGTIAWS